MALHPEFPTSPYAPLIPEQRWFPADETLRSAAYTAVNSAMVAAYWQIGRRIVEEEQENWSTLIDRVPLNLSNNPKDLGYAH